jgi:hypothetical protein
MSAAMRCHKCGYDFSNSGDSAHVCLSVPMDTVLRKALIRSGKVIELQQRTWVELTDEEKKNIFLKWYGKHWAYTEQMQSVMDSVEAKLKEKNT